MDPLVALRRSRLMRSQGEVEQFEQSLVALAERRDPADLPALHRAFDDSTEHIEVMWGLVHLVEAFDFVSGARAFVETVAEMSTSAPQWMTILAIRQLNHETAADLMIKSGQVAAPRARASLVCVLEAIASGRAEPVARKAQFAISQLVTAEVG
jgi:hypothetical protein